MSRSSDRDEERALEIARASFLVGALERLIVTALAAWHSSLVRRTAIRFVGAALVVQPFMAARSEETSAGRAGVAGGVIAVASATALVLQRFASRPTGPTWIVPVAALLAGLCLLGLARVKSERQS